MTAFPGKPVMPKDATPAPPSTMIIFGGSGDLTKRLVMPSLYNLARDGALDPAFSIVAVDIAEHDEDGYRAFLTETANSLAEAAGSEVDAKVWSWLMERTGYVQGDFDTPATYESVKQRILANEPASLGAVFYFAVAPRFFGPIADHLAAAGLMDEGEREFRRIVVEKPFGMDLDSARALNTRLLAAAEEHQIFPIDHFLGKETVQNVMAMRFGNGIF
jgi:glucose-6-phosphate 1-dehydrogenase